MHRCSLCGDVGTAIWKRWHGRAGHGRSQVLSFLWARSDGKSAEVRSLWKSTYREIRAVDAAGREASRVRWGVTSQNMAWTRHALPTHPTPTPELCKVHSESNLTTRRKREGQKLKYKRQMTNTAEFAWVYRKVRQLNFRLVIEIGSSR